MRRVAIVVFEGLQILDAAGPAEVFSQADRMLGRDGYEIELVGSSGSCSNGLDLGPATAPADASGPIDTLVVAGGMGITAAVGDGELIDWVAAAAARARRTASVCTGALLLARAGLLDGRWATTHWEACETLARRHPLVRVDAEPIFIRDGDVWTSAGVTAGIDLALALVEDDHGPALALEVARRLVMYVRRPGGQAQFSAQLAAGAVEEGPLRDVQAWIAENPAGDLSVGALARRVHMSPRTFARSFARDLGTTPAAYVEAVRIEQARARLERSDAPLSHVARASGFGSPETMRRAFQRRLGVAPTDYRSRFRPRGGDDHADRHPDLRPLHGTGRRRPV